MKDLRELGAKAFVLDNEINHLHKIEKQLAQYFRLAVTNHFKGKDSVCCLFVFVVVNVSVFSFLFQDLHQTTELFHVLGLFQDFL